jgi:UDP-xylose/UDP-N-acetylglucosamine transporter B4
MPELSSALLQSSVPELFEIFSLIFGGCCSNVWALESILKTHPASGTFLTFSQFIFVTLQNIGKFTERSTDGKALSGPREGRRAWSRLPRLKTREVPLKRWMGQVLLYLGISLCESA